MHELLDRGNGISSLQKQDKLSSFLVTLWGQDHLFKAFLSRSGQRAGSRMTFYLVSNKERALEYNMFGAPSKAGVRLYFLFFQYKHKHIFAHVHVCIII